MSPVLARPLLVATRERARPCTAATAWTLTREPTNPVITIPAGETVEQYVPAPVLLPDGRLVAYCKGGSRIWMHISTDGGTTFDAGVVVLSPVAATWESAFVLEPTAVYDDVADVIHVYYKGRNADASNWQWGHATAPGSTPGVLTRDPANPIFTKANALADLGASTEQDFGISSVHVCGGVYHFFGYGGFNSRFQLLHATGTTWNNPSGLTSLLLAENDNRILETPTVFSFRTKWGMLYARGDPQPDPRDIEFASSTGGLASWDFSDTTPIISRTGSGWEEKEAYSGQILKDKAGVPIAVGGKWLFYYSGLSAAHVATVGLIRIDQPCL